MSATPITVGNPKFWPEFYEAHAARLLSIAKLPELANLMFAVAQKKCTQPVEMAVNLLTRITFSCMNDVLVLCGNGSGTGALRIVRGMFESSTVAEYLRLHPNEAQDYEDFRHVIAWQRYQLMIRNAPNDKTLSTQTVERIQSEYGRVKDRFTNTRGHVRSRWLSVRKMAEAIGRDDQYELVYSWLSSIPHLDHEGLMAHTDFLRSGSPSLDLVDVALVAAHTYVMSALRTFNDCCELGFGEKIEEAAREGGYITAK
jgi:hypothetical protein